MARISLALCGLLPSLALAADPVVLCPGQVVFPGLDGRVLGHIPYGEVPAGDLVPAPPGFAIGVPCKVQRDVLPDLSRLLAAVAATPGVGPRLRAVSCFRSIAHQRSVFCSEIGPRRRCKNAAERAQSVAPPGYSEHATGYAIDFGIRPSPGCGDVSSCMASTPTGLWLIAHGREYGFEMSFPPGNAQGVTWEPWHWRWVGATVGAPGAVKARLTFTRARANFPANPGINDVSDYWLIPQRSIIALPDTPPATMPYITLPPAP
ncbi:MAG: D-alanyl-D-alanine carboxypeptidase [Sphingomonas bacterium]|uniref:M15 family metallopeptidase n=1 Tax=Sphingomonas bacterium TaxID=1895847 RepID=UPI0026182366|nr:M15 family metallopeptidase [Sphingomonas bacterium]MDB5708120.1 D-alanyl-D-alanine carboxypeptidase [Sphingomonas bacterium]